MQRGCHVFVYYANYNILFFSQFVLYIFLILRFLYEKVSTETFSQVIYKVLSNFLAVPKLFTSIHKQSEQDKTTYMIRQKTPSALESANLNDVIASRRSRALH